MVEVLPLPPGDAGDAPPGEAPPRLPASSRAGGAPPDEADAQPLYLPAPSPWAEAVRGAVRGGICWAFAAPVLAMVLWSAQYEHTSKVLGSGAAAVLLALASLYLQRRVRGRVVLDPVQGEVLRGVVLGAGADARFVVEADSPLERVVRVALVRRSRVQARGEACGVGPETEGRVELILDPDMRLPVTGWEVEESGPNTRWSRMRRSALQAAAVCGVGYFEEEANHAAGGDWRAASAAGVGAVLVAVLSILLGSAV